MFIFLSYRFWIILRKRTGMHLEEEYSSDGKTPRRLDRLSAEKFADCIALRALPIIELYFCEQKLIPTINKPNPEILLVIEPQILNIQDFLDIVGPLYTTALYSSSIVFLEVESLALLLQYTPDLKFIQLHRSYDRAILENLHCLCPTIEDIEIEITACEDCEHVEESLCKTFFCKLDKIQILKRIRYMQNVELSFPNLKSVRFYTLDEYRGPSLKWLVFFLKYFYPELKAKWFCSIDKVSLMPSIMNSGIWCPHLGNEERQRMILDGLAFHLEDSEDDDGTISTEYCLQAFLQCNYIFIDLDGHEDIAIPNFIEVLLKKFKCQSLKILYSVADSDSLAIRFQGIGSVLKELYLNGPLFSVNDGEQLYAILNTCVNLKVLSLQLDLTYKHSTGSVNSLKNLEILSIKVLNFPLWNNFPHNERGLDWYLRDRVINYMNQHSIAETLPAYLSVPGPSKDYYIHGSWNAFQNSVNALDFCEEADDVVYQPSSTSTWSKALPQLKGRKSHHEQVFGPGPLKYDLSYTGSGFYRSVEYLYDDDCSSAPAINSNMHGKKILSFYGNSNYGYSINQDERSSKKTLISTGNTPPELQNTLYKADIISNTPTIGNDSLCFLEAKAESKTVLHGVDLKQTENELKQWRLDMEYGAPVALLGALIQSSPNLKILEIPDLRLTDPFHIFNSLTTLSNVHTLHLSSQFTNPLVDSLVNLFSLKKVRIDDLYGIENFLRFKTKLRMTNLLVECGGSLVYPGSKYLFSE